MAIIDIPNPEDFWESFAGKGPISHVSYSFMCDEGPPVDWHVRRFELRQALSTPFEMSLELVAANLTVDATALLQQSCQLELERDTVSRSVFGIIETVERLGSVAKRAVVRVRVVPAFALMDIGQDSRAWQERTAPEILNDVLSQGLAKSGRRFDAKGLTRSDYPRRDYCVQFRESDFAFASRLMEEEGINYFFQFDEQAQAEVLVLTDSNAGFPVLEGTGKSTRTIPVIASKYERASVESIQRFETLEKSRVSSATWRDFSWEHPQSFEYKEGKGRREYYAHTERLFADDGQSLAARTLERLVVDSETSRGTANVVEFSPGRSFQLLQHAEDSLVGEEFILTRVTHRGDCPEETILAAMKDASPGDAKPRYQNEFECVARARVLRPAVRQPRPRTFGPQTATVTGPEGEEVHTDEHGRIKVLMHWDRLSDENERASWWVRVAQTWAGAGWGSMVIPRIGMEVVVDFLEGNPDRPLVVGCVYNGKNRPPYELPAEKTKTTIKSNSSIGGGGFNEIRFEDRASQEEVYIHAQKDMNIKVRNNKTQHVQANESLYVGVNRTRNVGANEQVSVGLNRSETVGVNRSVAVGAVQTETVGASCTRSIGTAYSVNVGASMSQLVGACLSETIGEDRSASTGGMESWMVGQSRHESIGEDLATDVGASLTLSVGEKIAVSGGDDAVVSISGNVAVSGQKQGTMVLGEKLTVLVGEAIVQVEKNGDISIQGKKIRVTGSGEITIKGSKVALN